MEDFREVQDEQKKDDVKEITGEKTENMEIDDKRTMKPLQTRRNMRKSATFAGDRKARQEA